MKFSALLVLALTYATLASAQDPKDFRPKNADDAEALQKKFDQLNENSPCQTNDQACVNKQFAQCVGGKFSLTSCGAGLECAVLPLVNKPGTSITCTTEADRVARLADARGGQAKGNDGQPDNQPKNNQPQDGQPDNQPKTKNPKTKNPKSKKLKMKKPKKNDPKANDPKANDPKANDPKANDPMTNDPKANDPKANDPKANDPKANDPKANDPKANDPKANDPKTNDPKTNDPKINDLKANDTSANNPNNGSKADIRKNNADAAEALQKKFDQLNENSPCQTNDQACVNKQFAQCVGGKFSLTSCGGGLECAVLPLVNKAGTSIACTTEADRLARIDQARKNL